MPASCSRRGRARSASNFRRPAENSSGPTSAKERYWARSGNLMLNRSFSAFDPKRTSLHRNRLGGQCMAARSIVISASTTPGNSQPSVLNPACPNAAPNGSQIELFFSLDRSFEMLVDVAFAADAMEEAIHRITTQTLTTWNAPVLRGACPLAGHIGGGAIASTAIGSASNGEAERHTSSARGREEDSNTVRPARSKGQEMGSSAAYLRPKVRRGKLIRGDESYNHTN